MQAVGTRAFANDIRVVPTQPSDAEAEVRELAAEVARLRAALAGHSAALASLELQLDTAVSERTRLLERAKREWEASFDAISDPMAVVGADRRVLRANAAWARAAGVSLRDVVDQPCFALFGEAGPCAGCPLPKSLSSGARAESELRLSAQGRMVRASAFPLPRGSADDARAVCHYKDTTDERLVQARLVHTEKMVVVGQLASGVAHEINNPLSAIITFAQLLKADLEPHEELREYASDIEESALRCRDIVQSLLGLARSACDEWSILDLREVAKKSLLVVGHDFRPPLARLVVELDPAPVMVRGVSNQLQSILLNLLTNARQALPPTGGQVALRVFWAGADEACIEVRDNGSGMCRETLARIFEPFFTTKPEGQGTGLGLAITQGLVRDHGGTFEVQSEVGQGSVFRVRLPRWEPVEPA
jgi:two-component system NtrC family sensor kinase